MVREIRVYVAGFSSTVTDHELVQLFSGFDSIVVPDGRGPRHAVLKIRVENGREAELNALVREPQVRGERVKVASLDRLITPPDRYGWVRQRERLPELRLPDIVFFRDAQDGGGRPIKKLEDIVRLADAGDIAQLVWCLDSYAEEPPPGWSPQLFRELSMALRSASAGESDAWHAVGRAFVDGRFFGGEQCLFMLAPYRARREGTQVIALTGVYGERLASLEFSANWSDLIRQATGASPGDIVMSIIPFRNIASCGIASGAKPEAFLVPDGWAIPGSERGLALNNMSAQRERLKVGAFECIRRIFADETARLLLSFLENEQEGMEAQHREFQYHEAGHAAGRGLPAKLAEPGSILSTPWYRGVEEWRADGIEFELLQLQLLSGRVDSHVVAATIAANLVLRLGVDAHRNGGLELDTDVMAAQYQFHCMLESGALVIDRDNKLSLHEPSLEGLMFAVAEQRRQALQLTRNELALRSIEGIWGLYGNAQISRASRVVFDAMVTRRCEGVYPTDLLA